MGILSENKIELKDGELLFFPDFFSPSESKKYFEELSENIAWQQDRIKMFGKELPIPRLQALYGDADKPYTYSGIKMRPHNWTTVLLEIKQRIAEVCTHTFTSVLLNQYRHGKDSMGWHADDEPELGTNPVIASVNFGATRNFQLRRKDDHKEKRSLSLSNGSLLIMQGATQHYWQHQIPKTAKDVGVRINLTFRRVLLNK